MTNYNGRTTHRNAHLRAEVQDEHQATGSFAWTISGDTWLSILAWVLCLLALWQLGGTTAAQGYEISIYSALPPTFWYCLLSSLVLHAVVAARVCFGQDLTSTDQIAAVSGIAGVAVNTITVLLLPYLHGYLMLKGDISSHISRSVDIAGQRGISTTVFYPATYALVQIIHAATGLSVRDLWFLGAAGGYVLYILLCILGARAVFKDRRSRLYVGLAAAIPVAGAYLRVMSPASLSVQLLPLMIYLYIGSRSKKSWGFNLLLVLLLILLPFTHPLTTLMCALWLTLFEVTIWKFVRSNVDDPSLNTAPSLVLIITWFTWFSSFAAWNRGVKGVVNWLSGEANTQIGKVAYWVDRSRMSQTEVVLLGLKQHSGVIIYVGLAFASLLLYGFARQSGRKQESWRHLKPIYVLLIVSLIVAVAALVGPVGGLDVFRFARFLVPWATLIIGSVPLAGALVGRRGRSLFRFIATCALVVAAVGGVWALHPSPYVFRPNDQVTAQDITCVEWISQRGDGRAVMGIWTIKRLAHIALGYSAGKSLPGVRQFLPDHFGYDQFPYVSTALMDPAYLLITERDRVAVFEVWASANKYSEEDFRQLEMDPSVILLYSNGQCTIWATHLWKDYQIQ